jgi:hypothetical protein
MSWRAWRGCRHRTRRGAPAGGDNRYATIAGFKRAATLGAKLHAVAEDTFFAGLRKAGAPQQ